MKSKKPAFTIAVAFKKLGLSKGGKIEKERIFGKDANAPRLSEKREKMMNVAKDFVKRKFGLDTRVASGKRDAETGELREEADEAHQPYDVFTSEGRKKEKDLAAALKAKKIKRVDPKPDWRNKDKVLETQPSPDALVHEVAHLARAKIGNDLAKEQDDMDKEWGESQSKYGRMQQKKTKGEIQPMSLENPLRRRMGLPANKSTKKVSKNERALDDDTDRFVEGKDSKGRKAFYDRQSRLMNPETKQRLKDIDEGVVRYHKERGMVESNSPDALINLRGQGRMEEAKKRLKNRGADRFAKGGIVESIRAKMRKG